VTHVLPYNSYAVDKYKKESVELFVICTEVLTKPKDE